MPMNVMGQGSDHHKYLNIIMIQVGAVLHLVWEKVLETIGDNPMDFKIDVDFVCSMVPVEEKPDGKTAATQNYLMKQKPVGM